VNASQTTLLKKKRKKEKKQSSDYNIQTNSNVPICSAMYMYIT